MQDRYRELLMRQAEGGYAARRRKSRSRSRSRVRFGRGLYEEGETLSGGRRVNRRRRSSSRRRGGSLSGGRSYKKRSSTRKKSNSRRYRRGGVLSGGAGDSLMSLMASPSELYQRSVTSASRNKYGTRNPYDMFVDTLLQLNVQQKEHKLKAINAIEKIKEQQAIIEAELDNKKDEAARNYAALSAEEDETLTEAAQRLGEADREVQKMLAAYASIPGPRNPPTGYVSGNRVYKFGRKAFGALSPEYQTLIDSRKKKNLTPSGMDTVELARLLQGFTIPRRETEEELPPPARPSSSARRSASSSEKRSESRSRSTEI